MGPGLRGEVPVAVGGRALKLFERMFQKGGG